MGRWKTVIGPMLKARYFENQKTEARIGVLFELIARRYEYRSIAIAANQPFSG